MLEVERKFSISEIQYKKTQASLDAENSTSIPLRQIDQIFLFGSSSFKNFKRGDPVMRIRTSNDALYLTYKRSVTAGGDRIEHELKIDSAEVAQELLNELGYQQAVVVDKVRRNYVVGDLTVSLDDVHGLGYFIEVELLCASEDKVADAVTQILNYTRALGIPESALEERKYDEMLSSL